MKQLMILLSIKIIKVTYKNFYKPKLPSQLKDLILEQKNLKLIRAKVQFKIIKILVYLPQLKTL